MHNPYFVNTGMYNTHRMCDSCKMYSCPYRSSAPMYSPRLDLPQSVLENSPTPLMDYGSQPLVIDIEDAAKQNKTFRRALWTGTHLQLTLMSINVGEDIGLEVHPDHDQFIRIEEGQGLVMMGDSQHNLNFQRRVHDDYAVFVPAGKWHNLINTGNKPIKLYSIYAPPEHPKGTVHETKAIAEAAEGHDHR